MSTVVEEVIARFRWNTNRAELREARKDTEGLRKATEDLEDEVTRQAKAQADLRKELVRVRKERASGKGDTKALKAREAELRSALLEQAEASKAAREALKTLRAEQRGAAADARAEAKAEAQAARERVRAAREVAREQVRATREVAAAERAAAKEAAATERSSVRAARQTAQAAGREERARAKLEQHVVRTIGGDPRAKRAAGRRAALAAYGGQHERERKAREEGDWTGNLRKEAAQRFRSAAGPGAVLDSASGALGGASSLARGALVGGVGAALAGGAGLGVGAARVGMEFEQLRTALQTTTGSAAAAEEAFGRIRTFAKQTPFDVQQVTTAFIKLTNRGLDASLPSLRAYGDTASAMGKSLDDMVEAVADATVGEFERLKEFGIKASVQGDKVRLTFRGVTSEVHKDAQSIERYLVDLGKANFAGGMEAQSKTLAGVLGGLEDSFKMFLDEVFRGEFGTALKEVAADLGLFSDEAGAAAPKISEVLAGAVRALWAAIKDFLGDPADLGERIAGWADTIGGALGVLADFAGAVIAIGEAAGPTGVALGLLGVAVAGMLGPLGLAFAAGAALGALLTNELIGAAQSAASEIAALTANIADVERSLASGKDGLATWRDRMMDLATSTDETASAFGRLMTRIAGSSASLERLWQVEEGRRRDAAKAEEAAAKTKALDDSRRGEAVRRQEAAEAAAAGMAARGGAAQQAKLRRFRELSKKKSRSPSEAKELTALAKELDLAKPTKPEKHKAESAYEADRDSEIKKLRQQAERRAGYRALLAGKSGAEQLSAAKAAGQATEDRLKARVAGGEALPGELNVGLLKSAGFNEVAGAGQPPPVAVTIVKVPEFSVAVTFSGPVTADLRMLREEMDGAIARRLPEALADGLRNVRWPTLY